MTAVFAAPAGPTASRRDTSPSAVPRAREFRHTTDRDEAIDVITEVYVPHNLVLPTCAVDMTLAWTPLRHLVLGYLSYGAESYLIAPKLETFYHVNLTIRGRTGSQRGAEEVETGNDVGLVFLPSEPATVHWSEDCMQLAMKIDKDGLEAELARLLNRQVTVPLRFDLALELKKPKVSSFVRALQHLRSELDEPDGIVASPLGVAQLEDTVITSLLLGQPSNYYDELHSSAGSALPRTIAPVVDLMESEPDNPRSLGAYASVAGLSVRALQDTFRRTLEVTPMEYLRGVQFDRVRADLLASDPETTTVTQVMHRWGFTHAGRFSTNYRKRFKELPSETLRCH
ncbi:AraC family transcriptional regulator [Nocardioides immobilis]|uniref:AraC family transcriptional regulator n=1 Tax=Nocardioides immobilis TaxID=2049295 RepID=A0A417Y7B2_9ACTN|nr:AraC family transcriptional regulator [Nocardioides immobilis]RHW28391.1 AraC family transcriptional regulator [Nocardioides immobilis]